jgi:preprotein translocase subunit SecE
MAAIRWTEQDWPFERSNTGTKIMAKNSPGEFIRQVRAETAKVVWPTRKETTQTAIMVLIMTIILAIFFLGVDAVFNGIVQALLSLATGG